MFDKHIINEGLQVSRLRFYSLGVVAENKRLSSKEIYVTPIEDLSMYDGELNAKEESIKETGKDALAKDYTKSVNSSNTIIARWLSLGTPNRLTAPDVRTGEMVVIYQFGDHNRYYWSTISEDISLRRLETVIWAISGSASDNDKVNPQNTYYLEVSSHKKIVKFHTSKVNGEKVSYDVTFDTGNGVFSIKDSNSNELTWDSNSSSLGLKFQQVSITGSLSVGGGLGVAAGGSFGASFSAGSDITAGGNISAGKSLKAGESISSTKDISSGSNVSAGGNMVSTGNVSAGGNMTAGGDVVGGGVSLKAHSHKGVLPGMAETEKPTPGAAGSPDTVEGPEDEGELGEEVQMVRAKHLAGEELNKFIKSEEARLGRPLTGNERLDMYFGWYKVPAGSEYAQATGSGNLTGPFVIGGSATTGGGGGGGTGGGVPAPPAPTIPPSGLDPIARRIAREETFLKRKLTQDEKIAVFLGRYVFQSAEEGVSNSNVPPTPTPAPGPTPTPSPTPAPDPAPAPRLTLAQQIALEEEHLGRRMSADERIEAFLGTYVFTYKENTTTTIVSTRSAMLTSSAATQASLITITPQNQASNPMGNINAVAEANLGRALTETERVTAFIDSHELGQRFDNNVMNARRSLGREITPFELDAIMAGASITSIEGRRKLITVPYTDKYGNLLYPVNDPNIYGPNTPEVFYIRGAKLEKTGKDAKGRDIKKSVFFTDPIYTDKYGNILPLVVVETPMEIVLTNGLIKPKEGTMLEQKLVKTNPLTGNEDIYPILLRDSARDPGKPESLPATGDYISNY